MTTWKNIDDFTEPRDSFDAAVGSLIALLNFVQDSNAAIGIDDFIDMRNDVAEAMRFNNSMSEDERADAIALIEGNNDVFGTIDQLKKNRRDRKKRASKK